MPMRDVCNVKTQMLLDSGAIAYRQPTYEEVLAKANASLSEVIKVLETESCTILLGPAAGQAYYELCLVYKPGSAVGEGEAEIICGSAESDFWLSEDGLTLYFSYHFENRAIYEGLPPDAYHSLPETGTCLYTIDLNSLGKSMGIQSD